LILQGALALLLIVHSAIAWTGEADVFQDQVGEYVSTLKKSSIIDGAWSEDYNSNEEPMLLDCAVIDQSADDEEEWNDDSVAEDTIASYEQRWLKGKKGKKGKKKKKASQRQVLPLWRLPEHPHAHLLDSFPVQRERGCPRRRRARKRCPRKRVY
jgi:hypothetical protein